MAAEFDQKAKVNDDPFDLGDGEEKKASDPFNFDFDNGNKGQEVIVETKTVEVKEDPFAFGTDEKPASNVMDIMDSQPPQSFDPLNSVPTTSSGGDNLANVGLVFDTPAPVASPQPTTDPFIQEEPSLQ